MTFRIVALDPVPFALLFGLTDTELAARDIVRITATVSPGSPCRVSLADAEVGDILLLLSYEHLAVASPYRSRHAIYVREGAVQARPQSGAVPPMIASRLISARAFDAEGMMTNAEVLDGDGIAALLEQWFADAVVAHVDLHNARPGCFAARAVRA